MKRLVDAYPEISQEYSKNNDIELNSLSSVSGKSVLWVCKSNHEYRCKVSNRTSLGRACPYCSGRLAITGVNDLETLMPDLASEWSESNSRKPSEVKPGSHLKVEWICADGHTWTASVENRSKGAGTGCPYCSGRKAIEGITSLNVVRPDVFLSTDNSMRDYAKTLTEFSDKFMLFSCENNHTWETRVKNVSRGQKCPECFNINKSSLGEDAIFNFVSDLSVSSVLRHDRSAIYPYELDIYIPGRKIAIEFNGVYWHSEKFKNKEYHAIKNKMSQDRGINLLTIWEDDWTLKNQTVKSMLLHKLGETEQNKVFARKCSITNIPSHQARSFLNKHHIQGASRSSVYLGLQHNNNLVAVAAFRKNKDDVYLDRYATACVVVGGHSKLVSFFYKTYAPKKLITFADLQISDGNLYEKTGWTLDKEIPVDYSYVGKFTGWTRAHKFGFRLNKFKIHPDLLYEEGKTESELAAINNLYRVWDCGKLRYEYKPTQLV